MTEDTLDDKSLIMSEIMPPDKANFSGNIHGGHIMMLLDRVAYACAARYAQSNMVTLSTDQVLFKKPVYVGDLVTFYAHVNYVGKTSCEVGIKVIAENLITQEKRHTNSCYFTMVAVNEKGKPKPIKPITFNHDRDRYRYEEAKLRRQLQAQYLDEHTRHKKKLREQILKK